MTRDVSPSGDRRRSQLPARDKAPRGASVPEGRAVHETVPGAPTPGAGGFPKEAAGDLLARIKDLAKDELGDPRTQWVGDPITATQMYRGDRPYLLESLRAARAGTLPDFVQRRLADFIIDTATCLALMVQCRRVLNEARP